MSAQFYRTTTIFNPTNIETNTQHTAAWRFPRTSLARFHPFEVFMAW